MLEEISENQVNEESNNNLIFLKGRFKSKSLNLYGLFVIIFTANGKIDSYNTVVSTFSTVFGLEPHQNWDKFEEAIVNFRWNGNFNNSMTSSLLSQIESISNDSFLLNQLYSFVNDYDYNHAEIFLFDTLNRVVQDKNLILEIGIQEATREEIARHKQQTDQKQSTPAPAQPSSGKSGNIKDGSTILSTSLVLAPVRGKPLYELKIGDKIMLKIEPATEQANYFIDYYELRNEDRIKPIPAEVIDIKSESKSSPIEILSKIEDGLYGKSIEEERQVKLRVYDPRYDGNFKHLLKKETTADTIKKAEKVPGSGMSSGMIMLISLCVIIFILLLAIVYILV